MMARRLDIVIPLAQIHSPFLLSSSNKHYYITPVLLLSSSDKSIVLREQCYNTMLLKSMGL